MKTFAIIPVKRFENSKTRLSSILSADERVQLAGLMLQDTLAALAPSHLDIVVVSPDDRAGEIAGQHGAQFIREERDSGVNAAVRLADDYCSRAGADATVVVPEDLPLLTARDINEICALAEKDRHCVVICPSARYDGTNILLRRPPAAITTHYDNDSYNRHSEAAIRAKVVLHVSRIDKLMFDIDTPSDIARLVKTKDASAEATLKFLLDRIA